MDAHLPARISATEAVMASALAANFFFFFFLPKKTHIPTQNGCSIVSRMWDCWLLHLSSDLRYTLVPFPACVRTAKCGFRQVTVQMCAFHQGSALCRWNVSAQFGRSCGRILLTLRSSKKTCDCGLLLLSVCASKNKETQRECTTCECFPNSWRCTWTRGIIRDGIVLRL